jgi:multisubunit Na+/H+ antiporter MnhE subunit
VSGLSLRPRIGSRRVGVGLRRMATTPSPRDRPRHPGAVRAWMIWWVLLAGLWLALVDTVVVPELVAGAIAAAIAATGAVIVRGQRRLLLRPRARWMRHAAGPIARTVPELGPLAVALWRRGVRRRDERGRLVEVPYTAVGDDPTDAAHRAFTQALGSLAPNTVVVGIDVERRILLLHELVATDDPAARAMPLPDP